MINLFRVNRYERIKMRQMTHFTLILCDCVLPVYNAVGIKASLHTRLSLQFLVQFPSFDGCEQARQS